MEPIDLFSLREQFNRNRIMLCFNGPISRSLIEEVGHALKNYLQTDKVHPSAAMDVFGIYVELTQNIRHYAGSKGNDDITNSATVIVGRSAEGRYVVQAGNLVEQADGEAVLARIQAIAAMDKATLKAAYKEQLRKPRDPNASTGAGLGLLDMARKSAEPLSAQLSLSEQGRAFLTVRAVV